MARRKWILVAVVALFAIAVLVQFRRTPEEPYLAEVPFSDGKTKYRLLKLTDGPLDYDWKSPSTPPILRILPPRFLPPHVSFIPVHLDGYTRFDRFPGVSYYFRPVDWNGRYTSRPMDPNKAFAPGIDFQESTGFVFRGANQHLPAPEHSIHGTAGSTVSAIPRRDPTLKILIHESWSQTSGPTHVMEVKNPFYKPEFPTWQGKGLPQEAEVNDPGAPEGAKVTLRKLVFGATGHLHDHSDFKVKSGSWHPFHDVWLEDATGNRGARLSPFEPAWKVHFSLAPSPDVEYPAERVWRVGSFKRPADLTLVELTPPKDLAGLGIASAILTGAGCVETVNDKSSMAPLSAEFDKGVRFPGVTSVKLTGVNSQRLESSQPLLVLKSLHTDPDFAVLIRLKSATKTLGFNHVAITSNDFRYTHNQFDRWPDDGEEWSLEVIYAKKPGVEFLVTPPDDAREILMKPIQRY